MCSEFGQLPKSNDKINVVGNTTDSDQGHVLMADMLKNIIGLKITHGCETLVPHVI